MKLIDMVNEVYSPRFEGYTVYFTVKGKEKPLSWAWTSPIRLTFDGKYPEREWASISEMLKNLFPEQWLKVKHHFEDERTQQKLDEVKHSADLVRISHSKDEPPVDVQFQWEGPINLTGSGKYDVGLINGTWAVQYSYRCAIDDYDLVTLYFDRKPTPGMLRTAQLVEEIETFFNFHGWEKVFFRCWECGRKLHWLDIDLDSIPEQWEAYQESYCGC